MQDQDDFDRLGWTALDCIAADARIAGKAVMYDPYGAGFVQCDAEDAHEAAFAQCEVES